VSVSPLGKSPAVPLLEHRLSVLEAVARTRPWLGVRVSEERLLAPLAAGYDAVVMGADKWLQVTDPSWYGGSVAARDAAVAALPRVLFVGRAGTSVGPPPGSLVLDLDATLAGVSSSAVRAGRTEWMCEEASAFDTETGAWTDPARYRRTYPAG
jgi:nicotinate-nucleotide adenylyltransferase